ncbi:hypothetical protein HIM_02325 [Hirsutella minnesotensis 3608]|nr:hypothetical protein HIM_02325 [Hirsutella minnesotensis 3608]
MIDTENLYTASLYINNQLVSRGLLRDGQTIDFAQLGQDEQTTATTAARIISVVNDLILRRDRDAEQRESISVAIRSLRAENLKLTSDVARLTDKNAEEKRRADIAAASEAALKTQLKSAEASARGQKEEITRMKSLVSQTRAACATEVRRRDRQIDTLKKQLAEAGRSRGSKASAAVTTIHVTGDFGLEKSSPLPADSDLRSETNAFLSKLAQELSEENETILSVMQQTMSQLRDMSGYTESEARNREVMARPTCQELAADLASVTDHMRTILTNPSFVPIEEVEVREEEINRLRSGWVKMESRWKEAVHLIDGWRKRMAASGRPVCDEELRMGLRLSPVRVMDVDETRGAFDMRLPSLPEEEEELQRSPCPSNHDHVDLVPEPSDDDAAGNTSDGGASSESDHEAHNDNHANEGNVEAPRYQASPDSSPLPEPPQLSPLRNSSSAGNRGSLKTKRLRPKLGDFTTIVEERTQELPQEPRSLRSVPLRPRAPIAAAAETATKATQRRVSSRAREQRRAGQPRRARRRADASRLTATAASTTRKPETAACSAEIRARRATRPPRRRRTPRERTPTDVDPVKRDALPPAAGADQGPDQPRPEKRKRDRKASKTASRRRSTLSPLELEALITGGAAA